MSEKERLQIRIFVCRNVLADHRAAERLREYSLDGRTQIEQVPCLGRIDPRYLLKAFEGGCDAVFLVGCAVGKCRTMDGNLRAEKRAVLVRRLLDEIGIQGERLSLLLREPLGEDEVPEIVKEFLESVRQIGPSQLRISRSLE